MARIFIPAPAYLNRFEINRLIGKSVRAVAYSEAKWELKPVAFSSRFVRYRPEAAWAALKGRNFLPKELLEFNEPVTWKVNKR